jgi:hypothetical protein
VGNRGDYGPVTVAAVVVGGAVVTVGVGGTDGTVVN